MRSSQLARQAPPQKHHDHTVKLQTLSYYTDYFQLKKKNIKMIKTINK